MRGATFAHRGLHRAAVTENSPAAFGGAIAAGFGIECDVQRTADQRAVVFHDWEFDRLTAETGPVADRTAEEIERITLTGEGGTIPTLERFLDQVAGQVPVLIEVKSRRNMRIGPLCLAVHRALEGYQGKHGVMSFDPRVSHWFSVHSPLTARGLVVTEEGKKSLLGRLELHWSLWLARPDFLAYDIRDLPSKFAAAQRQRGLPLMAWTVRTPDLRQLAVQFADAPIAEADGLGAAPSEAASGA